MPTTPSQFRFTVAELATMDELVRLRGYKSRVALLRILVAEDAERMAAALRSGPLPPGPLKVAPPIAVVPRHQPGVYSDPKDCSHPIGRRIGKACSQCGAEVR